MTEPLPKMTASGSSLGDRLGARSLLGFFSHRVLRGGPKVLLNLAALLVTLILITKFLPSHMSELSFGNAYESIWHGVGGKPEEAAAPAKSVANGANGGGLRIVVFGENDIATPRGEDGVKNDLTWTEALCKELNCSSYLSMVPPVVQTGWSISSNSLYASAVEKILGATADANSPALDYSYLPEHYPVRWDAPDLKWQVSTFLALDKPANPPEETLWIFSFGMWDIWSLASLPGEVSKPLVETLAADIFAHVEELYQASLDVDSIAYSDFSIGDPQLGATGLQRRDGETAGAGGEEEAKPAAEAEVEAKPAAVPPAGRRERFRVLVPELFDPSMLPAWNDLRPSLPPSHSRAEQLRNAAELTTEWNRRISQWMNNWVRTSDKEPATGESKQAAPAGGDGGSDMGDKTVEPPARRDEGSPPDEPAPAAAAPKKPFPRPVPPQRDGFLHELPQYLLGIMADRQMHATGTKDSDGYGERPDNQTYREVWVPCVPARNPVGLGMAVTDADIHPNVGTDGVDGKPNWIGTDWLQKAKQRFKQDRKKGAKAGEVKAGQYRPAGAGGEGEAAPPAPAAEEERIGGVCAEPDQHLFHTPLTLSRRAIAEVAQQCAEMIRTNDSLRGWWEKAEREKAKGGRSWTG